MILSFYGRCCLLGLALISVAGLDSAAGQLGLPRLDVLFEKFSKLTEKVDKNAEVLKNQFDDKLTKLTEDVKRNNQLIKDLNNEMFNVISLCRMPNGALVCRTNSHGSGWTVIQQRYDGSLDFQRNWREYRDGFGEVGPHTEFWWGLEKVHQLTKSGKYELLMEFKDGAGEYRFARYSDFVVEGESEKYRLARLGGYEGTAGDINEHRDINLIPTGQQFSTHDNNNNIARYNCAATLGGGWWYRQCGFGPNSRWNSANQWQAWKDEPLHYSRMLIRSKV